MVNRSSQKGFTLLELAIVLVIIGIILGAILKGQELINNAKAKRVLNDMKGLASMYYTFYDRYGRFPGDCDNNGAIDANAVENVTVGYFDNADNTGTTNTNNGANFCYNPANPGADFDLDAQWFELKKAQLVSFSNVRDIVKHVFSGPMYAAAPLIPKDTGKPYNTIVVREVPCYVAKMIDQSIDNSLDAGKGAIREVIDGSGVITKSGDWSCKEEQELVNFVYLFDRKPND